MMRLMIFLAAWLCAAPAQAHTFDAATLTLTEGPATVTVAAAGFETVTTTVTVARDAVVELQVALHEPLPVLGDDGPHV